MTTNGNAALAVAEHAAGHLVSYTNEQLALIKSTLVDRDITNQEFALFIEVAKRTGLDPFRKQVYAIKRGGKMTIQTGIDGFRVLALRSGQYEGQTPPQWCAEDGVWRDVWLDAKPPAAARVGVWRKGFREPVWGVARFNAYKQGNLWNTMGEVMIAKVAEALAIRKAFPEDVGDLYTKEEMDQADRPAPVVVTPDGEVLEPERPPSPAPAPRDAMAALYDQRRRELEACAGHTTFDAFKKVVKKIGDEKNRALLGLEQAAQLKELAEMVKASIKARAESKAIADAKAAGDVGSPLDDPNDGNEAWGMPGPKVVDHGPERGVDRIDMSGAPDADEGP